VTQTCVHGSVHVTTGTGTAGSSVAESVAVQYDDVWSVSRVNVWSFLEHRRSTLSMSSTRTLTAHGAAVSCGSSTLAEGPSCGSSVGWQLSASLSDDFTSLSPTDDSRASANEHNV